MPAYFFSGASVAHPFGHAAMRCVAQLATKHSGMSRRRKRARQGGEEGRLGPGQCGRCLAVLLWLFYSRLVLL